MTAIVSCVDTASAANEPDANGVYRYLEIAEDNDFRVYATPGETIHVTVYPGVRLDPGNYFPDARFCQQIRVLRGDGAPVAGTLRISGVRPDGSTFGLGKGQSVVTRDPASPTEATTCNGGRPFQELTISYTVPAGYTIANMGEAFIVKFVNNTYFTHSSGRDSAQGYEWRVAVSDNQNFINDSSRPDSTAKSGRVWFVGDDTGLDLWQRNAQQALTANVTNHVFKFVRNDGYRYTVRYNDYHGIWSTFHGGVYGVRLNDDSPAYMSYGSNRNNSAYKFTLPAGEKNVAYVFVDCTWNDDNCPASIPFLRSQPITSDNGQTGNPIANANGNPTATTGFRYTGYTAPNLAGGTVTIPYTAMQTGRIRLEITRSSSATPLCRFTFPFIDDADGTGTLTWNWNNSAHRAMCEAGTSLNAGNVTNVPGSEVMTIRVQATRLGEMHFIDVDTEQRGGIEVKGNGLGTAEQKRSIIWYDPFSRSSSDTCGVIPPRVAGGGLSHGTTTWDSMSSGQDLSGGILPKVVANGASSSMDRRAFDSQGGVHGWESEDGCDGSGTGASDGYANNSGTASAESTWGNDRIVEDWTYAFRDPPAQVLYIGGPSYTLTPSVSVSPGQTIGVGEQATFTMNVLNSSTDPSNDTDWTIRRIEIPPGGTRNQTPRNDPTNANDFSCVYYLSVGGGVTCGDVASGNQIFSASSTSVGTRSESSASMAIGTRICYALMVNSYNQHPRPNYAEAVACVTVAKFPQLEARNGDVFAGGQFASVSATCNITTRPVVASSQRQISGTYFTSYATYGVTSLGSALTFGSMGLSYGSSTTADDLVFANNTANQGFFYNTTGNTDGLPIEGHCLNDPFVVFGPRATNNVGGTSINIDTLGTSTNLTTSGTVTLSASQPIPAGKKIVIYAKSADIKITSDIAYSDGPYASINDIPQIVILTDNNITIAPSVTRLDGIYAAKKNFYTCDVVPRLNTCTSALTVNGAVVVGENVIPLRTYGADPVTGFGTKAETFNLRFDMFVNQLPETGGSDVFIKTMSETEVPPRF